MASHTDPRIDWADFGERAPGVVTALRAFGKAVDDSGLDKKLTELIKIRASQINGCAFCLQFHLNIARKLGVSSTKIDLVATWAETDVYTERERMALAWTEALTGMAKRPVDDALYAELLSHFSPEEVVNLTASIGAINAWNRIAGGLRFAPPIPQKKASEEAAA